MTLQALFSRVQDVLIKDIDEQVTLHSKSIFKLNSLVFQKAWFFLTILEDLKKKKDTGFHSNLNAPRCL